MHNTISKTVLGHAHVVIVAYCKVSDNSIRRLHCGALKTV